MIVGVHQPHYLPWLRYLHKIASCDVFVLLDDAQFSKNGWQNRNKIKGPNGPVLLTVPVRDPAFKPINEVHVEPTLPWRTKHWKSLATCYGKTPYFHNFAAFLEEVYTTSWDRLVDLNFRLLDGFCAAFGIRTPRVLSSSLSITGHGAERLVEICRRLGANRYLSGAYAAGNHLEVQAFCEAGIEVTTQEWRCPVYRQEFPATGFLPDLSAVDLLFNEGPASLRILEPPPTPPPLAIARA